MVDGAQDDPHILLSKPSSRPTILDFYSVHDQASKAMDSDLAKFEDNFGTKQKKINFIHVDADDPKNADLLKKYKVKEIPTLALLNEDGSWQCAFSGGTSCGSADSSIASIVGYAISEDPESLYKESPMPEVIDFYSDSCGACTAIGHDLEKFEKEYDGKQHSIKFSRVDAEDPKNQELCEKYNVTVLPTIIFVNDDGTPAKPIIGAAQNHEGNNQAIADRLKQIAGDRVDLSQIDRLAHIDDVPENTLAELKHLSRSQRGDLFREAVQATINLGSPWSDVASTIVKCSEYHRNSDGNWDANYYRTRAFNNAVRMLPNEPVESWNPGQTISKRDLVAQIANDCGFQLDTNGPSNRVDWIKRVNEIREYQAKREAEIDTFVKGSEARINCGNGDLAYIMGSSSDTYKTVRLSNGQQFTLKLTAVGNLTYKDERGLWISNDKPKHLPNPGADLSKEFHTWTLYKLSPTNKDVRYSTNVTERKAIAVDTQKNKVRIMQANGKTITLE